MHGEMFPLVLVLIPFHLEQVLVVQLDLVSLDLESVVYVKRQFVGLDVSCHEVKFANHVSLSHIGPEFVDQLSGCFGLRHWESKSPYIARDWQIRETLTLDSVALQSGNDVRKRTALVALSSVTSLKALITENGARFTVLHNISLSIEDGACVELTLRAVPNGCSRTLTTAGSISADRCELTCRDWIER